MVARFEYVRWVFDGLHRRFRFGVSCIEVSLGTGVQHSGLAV